MSSYNIKLNKPIMINFKCPNKACQMSGASLVYDPKDIEPTKERIRKDTCPKCGGNYVVI